MARRYRNQSGNLQLIIALSALMISLCALFVSVYETSILNAQQRASTWPYVDAGFTYNSEGYGFYISNNGIGPARISKVSVSLNDKAYPNWLTLVSDVLGSDSGVNYNIARITTVNNKVLPPQENWTMFRVPWTEETRRLEEQSRNLNVTICYCSVFDDCWVTSNKEGAGREIACPIKEGEEFQD